MRRFGEKLRFLRKQHQMTLKELALQLGYTAHSHISQIESGKKKANCRICHKRIRSIWCEHRPTPKR